MALVVTPTGQQVFVPDDLATFMSPQITTGEYGGGGATTLPPPPPPPPPPVKQFGPGGGIVEETAGPVPGAQTPVSAFPGGVVEPAPMQPITARPEIPVDAGGIVKRGAEQAKTDKAAAKQAAQQAAYQASPQGQIETGENAALGAVGQQQQLVQQSGDVAAKEAEDIATLKRAGEGSAEYWRTRAAELDQRNQAGIAKAIKEREDAVAAEANFKIDDNRRWHNLSTGRKILAGISVALSGLGDALSRRTGPNLAMGIITGAIKDDVEAQLREREQLGKRIGIKQNSLDNYRKIAADDREAGQLKVAEEYKRVAAQIDATAAQYASPKAKLAAQMTAAQLQEHAASIISQHGEAAWNRDVKRQELANQRASIGISGGHLALAGKQFEYAKKHDRDQMLIEAAKLAQAGKVKESEEWLKRGISGTLAPVKDKDGNVVDYESTPLMQRDGKTRWIPTGSEAAVDKLRNEKVATDRLVQIMDQVIAAGPEWLSDSRNSDKLQQMKADWAAAKLEVKDVKQLGVIAGPDLDLIEDYLGTPDPTRYKDSTAGIERARKNLVSGMNIRMRAHDFTGTYDPPKIGSQGAGVTDSDVGTKAALSKSGDLESGSQKQVFDNAVRIATTGQGEAKRNAINLLMTLRLDSKSGTVRRDATFALDKLGIESTTGMPKGLGTPQGIPTPQQPAAMPTLEPPPPGAKTWVGRDGGTYWTDDAGTHRAK